MAGLKYSFVDEDGNPVTNTFELEYLTELAKHLNIPLTEKPIRYSFTSYSELEKLKATEVK